MTYKGGPFDEEETRASLVSWAFRQVAIWGGLGFVAYFLVNSGPLFGLGSAPNAPLPVIMPAPAGNAARNSMVLAADKRGHVILDSSINGAPVRFLVDTGATLVALTAKDAAAAGISLPLLHYSAAVDTANGRVPAAPVTLREIRIGQLSVAGVDAVVVENLGASLLGMSFLSRLESWQMKNGVLTMNW